jgi:hypothetical protein
MRREGLLETGGTPRDGRDSLETGGTPPASPSSLIETSMTAVGAAPLAASAAAAATPGEGGGQCGIMRLRF